MPAQTQSGDAAWHETLPYVLWRAQSAVHRRLQEEIDGLGVTVTQLGLAVHLHELGHMSASELARHVHLTPQSVTTAIGQMERTGWVRRVPHPTHKRIVWYELTALGRESMAAGRSRAAAVDAELDGPLAGADRTALIAGLTAVAKALEGDAASLTG